VINGEIPAKEQPKLIQYASNARWGTHSVIWDKNDGGDGIQHPAAFVHYKKHTRQLNIGSLEKYNSSAVNIIRGGASDVYAAIKDKTYPYPVLYFHDPKTRELVIVNVKGQNIASYYMMDNSKFDGKMSAQDVTVKLKGGLTKWIKSALS
jgi:hypothetical protein